MILDPGAAWLVEPADVGVRRTKAKIAEAVSLAQLYSAAQIDRALGTAAITADGSPTPTCKRSWTTRSDAVPPNRAGL
ncbi:hypothetical protein GCM10009735_86190 [Actinomadura chokoriensis]